MADGDWLIGLMGAEAGRNSGLIDSLSDVIGDLAVWGKRRGCIIVPRFLGERRDLPSRKRPARGADLAGINQLGRTLGSRREVSSP